MQACSAVSSLVTLTKVHRTPGRAIYLPGRGPRPTMGHSQSRSSTRLVCLPAKDGRDCATIDLPGFFLQTEQEEDTQVLLRLTGSVAMLLVESNEKKWKKRLRKENGKYVMYVVCNKAIYGTMNAALLAYKKLAKLLTG